MNFIFEIVDKSERKIHLTKERWKHITSPNSLHSYMVGYLEEVKKTLIQPDKIVIHSLDDKKADYYLHLKEKKVYLLVGVKYLNGTGFITTSFFTRKLIRI
ncbi:MAG: hypothetical protein AABX28_00035 [Nanoarchaeota archaeon]